MTQPHAKPDAGASAALLLAALAHTPYGVILLRRDDEGAFRVLWLNQAARRLEDLGGQALEGRLIEELGPYIKTSGVIEALEQARRAGGQPVHHQTRLYRDGRLVHCHDDHLFALPTGEVVLMYNDATERAQAEEELRQLSSAIEQSIDGVALLTLDGQILNANSALEGQTGLAPDQIRGASIADFLDLDREKLTIDQALEAVRQAGQLVGEGVQRRPDGSEIAVRVSLSTYKGADGDPAGMILISRDISGRRRRDEQLRLLSTAVDDATDGIMVTDGAIAPPGPRVRFVNHAFTRLTGYSPEETIGRTPAMLQGPKTDKAMLAELARALRGDQPWAGSIINYRKDQSEVVVEWHVSPVHDESGAVTHFVATLNDVTERERAREAERRSQQMAAIARTAVTYNHEINNPLQAIIGNVELLKDERLSAEGRESLESILDAAARIQDVIRRIEEVSVPVYVPYLGDKLMLDIGGAERAEDAEGGG